MQMSKDEIVRNYRESKSKTKQVHILADLNQTSVAQIKEILREAGCVTGPKPKNVVAAMKEMEPKKPATINQDFEEAVQEMIKESKEPKILETVQEETIKESKTPKIPVAVRELLMQRLSLLDGLIKKYEEEFDQIERYLGGD